MLYGIYTVFLAVLSAEDIRRYSLPVPVLAVGAVLGLAGRAWQGEVVSLPALLLSFVPGILLLVLSKISRGGIGAGDGLVFLVTGIFLGPGRTFLMLTGGLICTSLWGLILCAASFRRGAGCRKRRLPMVPFLWPAWILILGDGIARGGGFPGVLP